jgi:hypothetical protein
MKTKYLEYINSIISFADDISTAIREDNPETEAKLDVSVLQDLQRIDNDLDELATYLTSDSNAA